MKKKSPKGSLKPRNGFVQAALFRAAGAHGPSGKARRQADRMGLQAQIRSGKALVSDDRPELAAGLFRSIIRAKGENQMSKKGPVRLSATDEANRDMIDMVMAQRRPSGRVTFLSRMSAADWRNYDERGMDLTLRADLEAA